MQKSSSPMPNNLQYRIIRSARRRRAAFRISKDGILEILVPQRVSDAMAAKLLSGNMELIKKMLARAPRRKPLDLSENSCFMLLGSPYPLRFTHRLRIFDNAFMVPRGTAEEIKAAMIALYKELAAAIIRKRLPDLQAATGVFPENIRITSASSRWGSSSTTGTLSFSWKLIQCPVDCVDYVIVHELSHQKEMNHSAEFWKHVAKVIPDYKKKRQKLNEFAATLPDWD